MAKTPSRVYHNDTPKHAAARVLCGVDPKPVTGNAWTPTARGFPMPADIRVGESLTAYVKRVGLDNVPIETRRALDTGFTADAKAARTAPYIAEAGAKGFMQAVKNPLYRGTFPPHAGALAPEHVKALQWAVNQACSKKAQRDATEDDRGPQHRRNANAARAAIKALTS